MLFCEQAPQSCAKRQARDTSSPMSTILTTFSYHTELIDGLEIEKPLPKRPHATVQTFVIQWMGKNLQAGIDVLPELNVLCGSDRLVPDVTVAQQSARYVNGDLADGPDLAVEILSPGQSLADVLDKCNRLLRSGTAMCWIIWPEKRRAWNYSSDDLAETGPLSGDLFFRLKIQGSPQIVSRLPVQEIWAQLDQREL